ncbi:prepilin-type N-terminal cleavage/methylation domain-containing protein [Clostridium sp. SM-530-WT-3G]|uniref:prepilin-type N-terminal cleavage/methylation domain-containing protein n=1 Tax=Clostridium sp. SM-530-WT-3G TaxID=2725303 RepID=UPI00145C874A|nr:prepilin-type N-terminal cleavage/methylation domain-containing protein [Clostridium sp. SM-530-WT-3G]NME83051.1 prepilin-type N-terminal cleavage/methylation domain-containing protein [Clostridium sp. SM-530-WT-3G]
MNKLFIKKKNELNQKKKKGFTLIELIIVIAVIAILAAMAIPKFSSIRRDAKVNNDVAAAKNIATVTSTLIANGTITEAKTYDLGTDDTDGIATTIKSKLDGKAKDGKGEATGQSFKVEVGPDESVTVSCDNAVLYPEANVKEYTNKAEGKGTSTTSGSSNTDTNK